MKLRTTIVSLLAGLPLLADPGLSGPCAAATASARIVPTNEPGSPLVVHGQLFRPDGKTPAAGVIVYAYQTGADGLYGPQGNRDPRLRGWLKTDGDGRFRLETIRPGPYPNNRIAAHIHFQAWGNGVPVQYTEELLFDDDPFVQERVKVNSKSMGRFAFVQRVQNGAVQLNLKLKPTADRMEDNIRHGLRACGYRD
jgi:protocatechuate 3,4-dioxygenase beta subunit